MCLPEHLARGGEQPPRDDVEILPRSFTPPSGPSSCQRLGAPLRITERNNPKQLDNKLWQMLDADAATAAIWIHTCCKSVQLVFKLDSLNLVLRGSSWSFHYRSKHSIALTAHYVVMASIDASGVPPSSRERWRVCSERRGSKRIATPLSHSSDCLEPLSSTVSIAIHRVHGSSNTTVLHRHPTILLCFTARAAQSD
jgi:hypothetical protein